MPLEVDLISNMEQGSGFVPPASMPTWPIPVKRHKTRVAIDRKTIFAFIRMIVV
jgi:hypothetical protein